MPKFRRFTLARARLRSLLHLKARKPIGPPPRNTTCPSPPEEVYQLILPYCTNSVLASLCRVNQALGKPARIQLYTHISLMRTTRNYDQSEWDKCLHVRNGAVPILYTPRLLLHTLYDSKELSALARTLEIEVIINAGSFRQTISHIIHEVAPTLTTLRLLFNLFSPLIGHQIEPWYLLNPITRDFEHLTKLQLVNITNWGLFCLTSLLGRTPQLQVLLIDSYEQRGTSSIYVLPEYKWTDTLRELHICHTGSTFPYILVQLLYQTARNVEKLVWSHTPSMMAHHFRITGEDVWEFIGNMARLKVLVWKKGSSREFAHVVKRSGGFSSLEKVELGDGKVKASFPNLENLIIPPLPSLKHIDIIPKHCPNSTYRALVTAPTSLIRLPTAQLGEQLRAQLISCPELRVIHRPTSYHNKYPHTVKSWDQNNAHGILIRTYEREGTGMDRLILLKVRAQNGWMTYADFNGRSVSMRRLDAALEVCGDNVEWEELGRGLELCEVAFNILNA